MRALSVHHREARQEAIARGINIYLGSASTSADPMGMEIVGSSCELQHPPRLSIKKRHLLLSLIIPGKKKVKYLSVYLAPLIDELQDL